MLMIYNFSINYPEINVILISLFDKKKKKKRI